MPTLPHLGLILVILGTVALAFAVDIEESTNIDRKKYEKRNPGVILFSPVRVTVRRPLFYGGLITIAIGTAMHW